MHYFPLIYSSYSSAMMSFLPPFFIPLIPFIPLIVVWTLIIKGYALWHAARDGEKWWFIGLLVINTLGILEIMYLVWFRQNTSDRVRVSDSSV